MIEIAEMDEQKSQDLPGRRMEELSKNKAVV